MQRATTAEVNEDFRRRSPDEQPGQQVPSASPASFPRAPGSGPVAPAANPFAAINRPGIAANYDFQAQARARQQALIDQLHGIASGKIKSPAMEQFEQQVVQAQNQSMGNASRLRDVGPGGQAQIAARNAEAIQGQGIQSAALLQTQQQAAAEQQLARLYEQQRAGDLSEADSRSRGILGNRGLDDSLNQQEFGRMYGLEVDSARRSADRARADLGFDVDQQAQNRSTANAAVQGAGTAFGYMSNAMGNGGGANQGTDSLVGGWQDPAASEWKPYTTSSFYDIRDEGEK